MGSDSIDDMNWDELEFVLEPDGNFDFNKSVFNDVQRVCLKVLSSDCTDVLILRSAEAIQNDFDSAYHSDFKRFGNFLLGRNKIPFAQFYSQAYNVENFSDNFWYDFILDFSKMVKHDARIDSVSYFTHIYLLNKYDLKNIDSDSNLKNCAFSNISPKNFDIDPKDCFYQYVRDDGKIIEIIDNSDTDVVVNTYRFLFDNQEFENHLDEDTLEIDGDFKNVLVYKHSWKPVDGRLI